MKQPAPKDAAELDAVETREWLDSLDDILQSGGPLKVARLLRELNYHATESGVRLPFSANTPYINTISVRRPGPHPGRARIWSGASRASSAGTRWRWSCARTSDERHRRPHLDLSPRPPRCMKSASTTSSAATDDRAAATQSSSRATPRPASTRARILEGRLNEAAAGELPPGAAAGRRPVVLSASVADARLLAVPHGLDGPRPDHGDLPGALQPLPRRSRHCKTTSDAQGLGVPRRRRKRRTRIARRDHAGRPREARQPRSSSSTATCSGSTARCAATARSFRNSKAAFRGAGWNVIKVHLGPRLGSAPRQAIATACSSSGWAKSSTASTRSTPWSRAPTSASTSSAPTRGCSTWSSTSPTISWRSCRRGGHDPVKVYAAYKAAMETQGPADRHPRAARSRATAWARRAKARTSRISRRR